MKSVTTARFRNAFAALPKDVQEKARRCYNLWKQDNRHPGVHYKQVHTSDPIYSVRIGSSYRALGVKKEGTMVWFWIGSHEEYNKLISQL
ncbi:MAG TPA: hypothetical protein VF610_06700 [Segetibacter sp.]